MLRYPVQPVKSLLRKDGVSKCGKMLPIVPISLFGYFGLIISQILFRKCVIVRMPITDADFPIIDNQTDFKIDNQVERIYLYRIISATNSNFRVGLRFYKFPRKYQGLDTFISEDGAYYISAYRVTGNGGYWIIAPTIGQGGSAATRVNTTFNTSFFPYGTPIEGTYSNGGNVVIGKIKTDIISQ